MQSEGHLKNLNDFKKLWSVTHKFSYLISIELPYMPYIYSDFKTFSAESVPLKHLIKYWNAIPYGLTWITLLFENIWYICVISLIYVHTHTQIYNIYIYIYIYIYINFVTTAVVT